MGNGFDVLKERGFIQAWSDKKVFIENSENLSVYLGFDPTADSLHVGHLVSLMSLYWLKQAGHKVIAIVGTATAMIGDPSGKSEERNLLTREQVLDNVKGVEKSIHQILGNDITILANGSWFENMGALEFLRDLGKSFRIGTMLTKESVKSRLVDEGMSFTEFSYQILQAYDFLYLFEKYGINVQLGGNDQWGNITAGIDLIRKKTSKESFGVTFALLTKSDGSKIGKTAGGAIWLSEEKTSCFDFYQYFLRQQDSEVIKLLKLLTTMSLDKISELEKNITNENGGILAREELASYVTRMVHGEEGLKKALILTSAQNAGKKTDLTLDNIKTLASSEIGIKIPKSDLFGKNILDVLLLANLCSSKGEAKRLIVGNGVYLNNLVVTDVCEIIGNAHVLFEKYMMVSVGNKKKKLFMLL